VEGNLEKEGFPSDVYIISKVLLNAYTKYILPKFMSP